MKTHQKHQKLAKPKIGHFHRNEIAFVGAPCGLIESMAKTVAKQLSTSRITYIDADHASADARPEVPTHNTLIDKISCFQSDFVSMNAFDRKIILQSQDLALLNGNHFEAEKQLVFIHPKKEASLKKRLPQLTDIIGVVLCEGLEKPFDWLETGDVPILQSAHRDRIAHLVGKHIKPTAIKGLVLAGGKSTRMGADKGQMDYNGMPQVDFLLQEMKAVGLQSYVSCREDQYVNYTRIVDTFIGLGPMAAILSAFQEDPNSAWLVSAVDLPLVGRNTFDILMDSRDASKLATCFYNPETRFPDPLITLWEPKSYIRLLQFLAMGYSCPRKALINSEVKIVHLEQPEIMKNINTPEEKIAFKGSDVA